ncbi:CAP domain,Cysteine-rich secretory protein, allergen V5/Tpx-1-related [Cinara cedri]|uniref:CAP domain,Cysteine-rich secretory protein, allergen V5/Tpx-1-related n=1 Tax=Cinara cedri TaxID=506608 RepID=A0A5E4MKZ6_9HEMI|nr:CAP domain,Cysteine-rich secretory protein, allergen V5/Tpx-1-related [Cinara cedri]
MDKVIELGIKAVDCWYGEIEFFDFQVTNEQMAATSKALHFTQVVWKDSKELGVGASKSVKTGEIYLVCNYDLPGNVESDFKNNVLPPKSS